MLDFKSKQVYFMFFLTDADAFLLKLVRIEVQTDTSYNN